MHRKAHCKSFCVSNFFFPIYIDVSDDFIIGRPCYKIEWNTRLARELESNVSYVHHFLVLSLSFRSWTIFILSLSLPLLFCCRFFFFFSFFYYYITSTTTLRLLVLLPFHEERMFFKSECGRARFVRYADRWKICISEKNFIVYRTRLIDCRPSKFYD